MSDPTLVAQQLRMFRGDTPTFLITVTDRVGAAFDISGYEIWFTAKNNKDDPDASAVFQITTVTGDIVITSGVGGLAEATPPASATSGFTADRQLFYDVQLRNAALTRTYTVAAGTLTVTRDITRA